MNYFVEIDGIRNHDLVFSDQSRAVAFISGIKYGSSKQLLSYIESLHLKLGSMIMINERTYQIVGV